MAWLKKDTPAPKVQGHDVHINPFPLSDQHINRVVQRMERIRLTLQKIEDKKSDRYVGFQNELARLEMALLEYKHKKERKN